MLRWLLAPNAPSPKEGGDHMANVRELMRLAEELDMHGDEDETWEAQNLRRIAAEYRGLVEKGE